MVLVVLMLTVKIMEILCIEILYFQIEEHLIINNSKNYKNKLKLRINNFFLEK
jgi:hypothetical protein